MKSLHRRPLSLFSAGISVQPSPARRLKVGSAATWTAIATVLLFPPAAMAASFADGNFETPGHSGYVEVPTNGTIGPWKVIAGSVDYGTAPGQTACQTAGGNCVDLNGSGPGVISQTFDTCKPMYQVDFFMSRHKQLATQTATMVALVNGAQVGGPFTHGPSPAPGEWVAHSFTFPVGNLPTTSIGFKSTTNGNPVAAGPEIDNVSLKMLPCN